MTTRINEEMTGSLTWRVFGRLLSTLNQPLRAGSGVIEDS